MASEPEVQESTFQDSAIQASNSATSIPPASSSSADSLGSLFGTGNEVRRRNVPIQGEAIPQAPPPPPPSNETAVATVSTFSRLLTTILSFSTLIFKSPLVMVQNAISLVKTWWANLGPELTPLQQVSAFAKDFNKSYDAKIPWLNCSYYSAVSSIRTGLKPVIVFLSNKQKSDNALFAQSIINANEQLKERVQFWGCDISHAEAARTAETIFVHHFPCVLVIGLKNNQQNVIYRTSSPNNSLTQLVTKIETAEAELVTARHELEMRDMDRRLREEQDLEFQRTMEADRKRLEEEERKKQEEEEKQKKIEERENERIRRNTEQRERRISARQTLAPEPKEGGLCIQFKLPDGSRHPRKFAPDAQVEDIFMFVQSLDSSPGDYHLSTVFPVRKIERPNPGSSITISQVGIKNNDQLMVQEVALDDFSDDESDESD